jgi:hypothetical protein
MVAATLGQQSTSLSYIITANCQTEGSRWSFKSHVAKFEELPGIDD